MAVPSVLGDTLPYPPRNPLTAAGIALGKSLFFEPTLSASNRISCATCHQPAKAFTDGLPVPDTGESGRPLHRHAPSLINIAWAKGLFWDGGARDLESLSFAPLQHPDEMAQDLRALVAELRAIPGMPEKFAAAFGDTAISSARIARALAQYQRSLVRADSPYDRYRLGRQRLDTLAMEGLVLFRQHCARCHHEGHFTDYDYHNNGLDSLFGQAQEGVALGRGRITDRPADIGKFKTPSLRNVALTAPYMHDGRFERLDQVLHHYAAGIRRSPTLDSLLAVQGGIPLHPRQRQALLAFLHSLTDSSALRP